MAPAPFRKARAAATVALSSALSQSLEYLIPQQAAPRTSVNSAALDNAVALSAFGVVVIASVGGAVHLRARRADSAADVGMRG